MPIQELYAGIEILSSLMPNNPLKKIYTEIQLRADAIEEDFRLYANEYNAYYQTYKKSIEYFDAKHFERYSDIDSRLIISKIKNIKKILEDHDINHDKSIDQNNYSEQGTEINLKKSMIYLIA